MGEADMIDKWRTGRKWRRGRLIAVAGLLVEEGKLTASLSQKLETLAAGASRHPQPLEDVLLDVAVGRLLGVGEDRHAGLVLREGRAEEHAPLRRRDLDTGRGLDRAGPDAGRPDAVTQLGQIELGDLPGIAGAPVEREARAEVLGVEPRGAHDLHSRALGDLGVELRIPTELDRARVDEGPEPGGGELRHLVDGARHDPRNCGHAPVPELHGAPGHEPAESQRRQIQIALSKYTGRHPTCIQHGAERKENPHKGEGNHVRAFPQRCKKNCAEGDSCEPE
jgi:hypothetical protein